MFLWPLPGTEPEQGPPGMVKVDFLAIEAEQPWEVTSGENLLCLTPCSRWMHPTDSIKLRGPEPRRFNLDEVTMPNLKPYVHEAPLEVQAEPGSFGRFTTGVAVSGLAGATAMVGLLFTALGCGSDREGLCTAGLITLPVGLLALVPGIWMITSSGADVEVVPAQRRMGKSRGFDFGVTPSGVGATF
jgi:hypothetical protein